MQEPKLFQKLCEKLTRLTNVHELNENTLLDNLVLDSITVAELSNFIRSTYQRNIKLKDYVNRGNSLAELHLAILTCTENELDACSRSFEGYQQNMMAWFLVLMLNLFNRSFFRIKVHGHQMIDPTMQYIFFANHESHLDPFWIYCCLPRPIQKKVRTIAKKEHWDNWTGSFLSGLIGGIPIDRTGDVSEVLHYTLKQIQQGSSIIIFPEGTRTGNGKMQPFKSGIVWLARESKIPLLPVGIQGAFEAYPRSQSLPNFKFRRNHIHLQFGNPIITDSTEFQNQTDQTILHFLQKKIEALRGLE
ncbi:MAG: 1-acyl-sn-glycerol-3-phosphate acyltransferase [Desulfobacterales bacterium]|nr:1-acyl-sn-glycerol-3-phosphate acyltransferase [Desulfobacterales bacterium]